mgnify:CR=1 FL=1
MNIKTFIENKLKETNREGIGELLAYIDGAKFYEAPASTKYHGAKDGALAEHSKNVYELAHKVAKAWLEKGEYCKLKDSITICALLHDLGKCGDFGKQNYVENILKSGNRSEKQPFATNNELLFVDHEIRSVKLCSKFIDLTEDEEFAILYHNGLYGPLRYSIQGKETPLYMIIHFADMWASRVIETKEEE